MSVSEPEDMMMLLVFFVAAIVMGSLTHRLKLQERQVLQREERAQTLYRVTRRLGAARTRSEVLLAIADALSSALSAPASVLIPAPNSPSHLAECVGSFSVNAKERAVAMWVYLNCKAAGAGTETISQAAGLYYPLVVSERIQAVLAIDHSKIKMARHEIEGLVDIIGHLAAVALEREEFRERSVELQVLQNTQILHDALFDSVSHELKTPLSAIHGSVSAMFEDLSDKRTRELARIIAESSERLLQTVENILDMSRIESGMLKANLSNHDVCDVLNGPLRELAVELESLSVFLHIADAPPVLCDIGLTQIVVRNILRNACRYTPKGSRIEIHASSSEQIVEIQIRDNGPGLADPSRVFDKFYRGTSERTGELGLGLSIARRFIEAQNGTLDAENQGGAMFHIRLPKGNL